MTSQDLIFPQTRFQFIIPITHQTKYNLQTRVMMQYQTERHRQIGKSSVHIRKNFQGYYCACKALFKTPQEYKSHVLSTHHGIFIEGSSHFITKFSQIVLPCKCWDLYTNEHSHQPVQKIHSEQTFTKESSAALLSLANKNKPKLRKRDKNNKVEEELTTLLDYEKIPPQPLGVSPKEEATLVWNGFRLVPNKKHRHSSFFCGFCQIALDSIQEFISHCFDKCHQLEHADSSHFISLAEPQVDKPVANPEQVPVAPRPQVSRNRQRSFKRLKLQGVPTHLIKIYQLLQLRNFSKETKKQGTCSCGCGKVMSMSHYMKHIVLMHQQIVPKGSSHIVLRKRQYPSLAVLLEISSFDETPGWSCPCRPLVNMTGIEFVKHILYIHKGISLIYTSDKYRAQQ